jgi:hypothetical protein
VHPWASNVAVKKYSILGPLCNNKAGTIKEGNNDLGLERTQKAFCEPRLGNYGKVGVYHYVYIKELYLTTVSKQAIKFQHGHVSAVYILPIIKTNPLCSTLKLEFPKYFTVLPTCLSPLGHYQDHHKMIRKSTKS